MYRTDSLGNEIRLTFEEEIEFDKFKNIVFRYISYKMRTESEVIKKFKVHELAEKYLDLTIDYLKELKYIDDRNYTKLYIEDCINLKRISRKEIYFKLIQKGIDKTIIEEELDKQKEKLEQAEIRNIISILKMRRHKELDKNIRCILQKGYSYSKYKIAKEELDYAEEEKNE